MKDFLWGCLYTLITFGIMGACMVAYFMPVLLGKVY